MVKSIKRLIRTTKGLTSKLKRDTMELLSNKKENKTVNNISKKQVQSKASKLGNWLIVLGLSTIVLGFSARGITVYITGMTDQQRVLSAIFVTAIISSLIFINLKSIFKEK